MGALLQLLTLPVACLLVAWLRAASADAIATILRGGTPEPAIARPTTPRLAHIPHRPAPVMPAVAESTSRSRRAGHVLRVRAGSLSRGGLA